MSKISEKSSSSQKTDYLSKPLRELATDLYRKFERDIFFSTRVKIIVFYTLSVLAIVIVTAGLIQYIQQSSFKAVVDSLNSIIRTGDLETDIFTGVNDHIRTAQIVVFSVIMLGSILIGVIASRLALKPVREALALQRRFIASVAHELRTPLAILKTQNEVAKLDLTPSSTVAETLDDNIEEIDHITEIFNNLLLFNRVDTLESITFTEVDLTKLIETVVARLQLLSKKRGVSLVFEGAGALFVYGNATALEQAFFNVVKNAVAYTRRDGKVRIRSGTMTDEEITIDIVDNGVGIARKDLPHIFEPFYRTTTKQELGRGTGLGLALVFEIIKLHNGRILVESTVGSGTHVQISIPREPRLVTKKQEKVKRHRSNVSYDFSGEKRKISA